MTRQTAGRPDRQDDLPVLSGTCRALAEVEPDGWAVLHDLHRPGSAWADIERIVVGPGGILVMQTLPGHGDAIVTDGVLRVRGDIRGSDVVALTEAAASVTALLAPEHRRLVRSVLVLSGHRLAPTTVTGGTVVVGEERLAEHLRGMLPALPLAELPLVVDYLTAELGDDTSPEQWTVDDLLWSFPSDQAPVVPRQRVDVPPTGPSWSDRVLRYGTAALLVATVVNVLLAIRGA